MYLYLTILIASIFFPLVLSFDKKLHFYTQWKYVMPSIVLVALFYIVFDVYLTSIGVWGFNAQYHLNILIFNLPLEEILFFIAIPYASIFLHEALILYFPNFKLNDKVSKILTISLIIFSAILVVLHIDKAYTSYVFSLVILSLVFALSDKSKIINHYYLTFLIILIPFFIVNGILTGSFIEGEVVWYNDLENLGIRLFTIPIDDAAYGFSMILFSLLLTKRLKKTMRRI